MTHTIKNVRFMCTLIDKDGTEHPMDQHFDCVKKLVVHHERFRQGIKVTTLTIKEQAPPVEFQDPVRLDMLLPEDETMKARGVKVEGWVCCCCEDSREAEDIQAVHTEALCLDSEQKILNDSGVRIYVPVPGFIGLCSRHRAEHGVQAADPQPFPVHTSD